VDYYLHFHLSFHAVVFEHNDNFILEKLPYEDNTIDKLKRCAYSGEKLAVVTRAVTRVGQVQAGAVHVGAQNE
jgi:hypothetical protein